MLGHHISLHAVPCQQQTLQERVSEKPRSPSLVNPSTHCHVVSCEERFHASDMLCHDEKCSGKSHHVDHCDCFIGIVISYLHAHARPLKRIVKLCASVTTFPGQNKDSNFLISYDLPYDTAKNNPLCLPLSVTGPVLATHGRKKKRKQLAEPFWMRTSPHAPHTATITCVA